MKNIQIRLPKMLLIMTEHELLKALATAPDVFKRAVGRGKAEQRVQNTLRREAAGFGTWQLYECLKNNRIDQQLIKWIEGMKAEEAKTGLLEYLEYLVRENRL